MSLSKDNILEFEAELLRVTPSRWFKSNFISLDRYIEDYRICHEVIAPEDPSYSAKIYCEAASDPVHNLYENIDAVALQDCKGPKLFIGLDKEGLELSYRNYLRRKFYSELIELTYLMAFLGHEYEAFNFHVQKISHVGLVKIFMMGSSRRKSVIQSMDQLQLLLSVYDTILTHEPSIALLFSLIEKARGANCYVNPNVNTILERASEHGLKRFRR